MAVLDNPHLLGFCLLYSVWAIHTQQERSTLVIFNTQWSYSSLVAVAVYALLSDCQELFYLHKPRLANQCAKSFRQNATTTFWITTHIEKMKCGLL
jgi:hypothetical protein